MSGQLQFIVASGPCISDRRTQAFDWLFLAKSGLPTAIAIEDVYLVMRVLLETRKFWVDQQLIVEGVGLIHSFTS